MSQCALCGYKKSLVNSHILPRFFIPPVEDWQEYGKHAQTQPYLTLVDFSTAKPVYSKRRIHALRAEGFIERLLCADCDQNIIGAAEGYVRRCLYGSAADLKHAPPMKSYRRYVKKFGRVVREGFDQRCVDFPKFKRFQISILWRVSVAQGQFFKEARTNLTPTAKEQMRLELLTGKFDENFMPCLMERLDGFRSENFGLIQPPIYNENAIQFVIGGYRWNFFLKNAKPPIPYLRKDGHLLIAVSDIERFYTPDEVIRAR